MSFSGSHNRAFKAEFIKMKHSGMFWLAFGAAIFIPLITTLVACFVDIPDTGSGNKWDKYIENNFGAFTIFFYPLFLVLVMSRMVYLEHRSDTWKLMETQPVSRLALFIVKFEAAALIGLSCLVGLLLFSIIGGFIIQTAQPKYDFASHSISWMKVISAIIRFWITGMAILSAQYFFGLLIKSFAWPVGIGLFATIAGTILSEFNVFPWWPYMGTGKTANSYSGSIVGNFLLPHEKLALLWIAVFLVAGYAYYSSRTIKRAFFISPLRLVLTIFGITATFFLVSFINKPVVVERYHSTILSGEINDRQVKDVVLLDAISRDTVALIPVKNGSFHSEIKSLVPAGLYYLRAGQFREQLFMGDKDSIFLEIKTDKKSRSARISGTRMAENEFIRSNRGNVFWQLTDYAYEFTPEAFAKELVSNWKDEIKSIEKYKTPDQVRPSEDFISLQKKLLSVKALTLADLYYPQVFEVYHPNEKLKFPKYLDQIRETVNLNDSTLSAFSDYRNYISSKILSESGKENFVPALKAKVTNNELRDIILYEYALNQISNIRDSARREFIFASSQEEIKDENYKAHLSARLDQLKKMKRGNKAGNISSEGLNGAAYTLDKFKGRYIVIDVWATWCKPCLKEAPFFEELAERYTSEEIAFVSLSIDEQKDTWKMAAANKKNKVLQLWATNVDDELGKGYSAETIPRFILIDNRGNIVNSEMPPPSDPEFEAILVREVPSLRNVY